MSSQDDAVIMMMNPRIRKSPFFDQARRHGARVFSVYNHMFIPQGYRDPESEFR
ncbi:MAG: glycine cleavage system protein T, partial [Chloroflexi bacterium]|nr:glycine cleavage system protein T [Chloroflexota bacterium]